MDNHVYVVKCDSYENAERAVDRLLLALGGTAAILSGKKRVLVKPNLLMPRKPEDAITTHPVVVEAICKAFVDAGADVEIIDSTGGPHTKLLLKMLYGKTGIKQAAENSGAKLSLNTKSKNVSNHKGKILKSMDILSPVLDSDLVVSVAKAKTHSFQAMTGCVKNMFGCIPGLGKPLLHRKYPKREDFAAMLVDICEKVNPGLNILDAVVGMEGAGPAGGDPKHLGAIIGGFSPYAIDLAQCYLMGLRTDSVYTIAEAASRGLAPDDPELLGWLGDNRKTLRANFKPAITNTSDNPPKIMDTCTGCGDCTRICPMKCMEIRDKKAVINEKECIRCYCCHEFCSIKSILIE